MRCCPKCGVRYSDTDIRSMCPSCMVALTPCADEPVRDEMAQSGPVTLQSSASPTMPEISMPAQSMLPDINLPEMHIPEVTLPPTADISPSEPLPLAAQPPTPAEVVISPTVAPFPQPQRVPETPSATAKQQGGNPYPSTPIIIDRPVQSAIRRPAPAVEKPRISIHTQVEKPVASASATKQADIPTSVVRPLSTEEIAKNKSFNTTLTFLATLCAFFALFLLLSTSSANFSFFSFVFLCGFSVLTVFLVRQIIYYSAIQNVKFVPQGQIRLGAPLQFEMTVGVLKNIPIGEAHITISALETTTSGSGKNSEKHQYLLFKQEIPLRTSKYWPGGNLLAFHPQLTLPAKGIPSFEGRYNHIDWKANLWVGIPGWYPDIRKSLKLFVPPVSVGMAPPATYQWYSLPELRGYNAKIGFECRMGESNIPQLMAGRKIPFTVEITPDSGSVNKKIVVEISYDITSAGNDEHQTVDSVTCFRRGTTGATTQQENDLLNIPLNSPITYKGRFISTRWKITVRDDQAERFPVKQVFEVEVIPEMEGEVKKDEG